MAIIVNGINIPTNGDYIKVGNTDITKVNVVKNGITTTVWERMCIEPITLPESEIINYIDVSGGSLRNSNFDHSAYNHINAPYVGVDIYNIRDDNGSYNAWHSLTGTYIITPKSPYTKISCDFHRWGLVNAWANEETKVCVNDVELNIYTDYRYSVSNASSIKIECSLKTKGWDDHWKTEAFCCIYNVTLS